MRTCIKKRKEKKKSLFADYITDSAFGSNVKSVQLQTKLQAKDKWSSSNKLKLVQNTVKTKSMLIASRQKLRSLDNIAVSANCIVDTLQLGSVLFRHSGVEYCVVHNLPIVYYTPYQWGQSFSNILGWDIGKLCSTQFVNCVDSRHTL